MKKRILSMLLAGTMAAAMLAGCGGGSGSDGAQGTGGEAGSGASGEAGGGEGGEAAGDPVKIVLETFYFDAQQADLELVEAAINEITIPAGRSI